MKVYQAINAVQREMNLEGIGKTRKNVQQGYAFRGIDDIYNALSHLLAKHNLCILPRVLARHCEERATAKGGVIFYVTVEVEFDFISAEDGSRHIVRTFGEAMDSADKATNKAMSAAYKYAAIQAFAIPTEGENDADGATHEVAPKTGMSKSEVIDHRSAIEAASTMDDLATAYAAAYKAARNAQDASARSVFDDAKDARKAALAAADSTAQRAAA